MGGGKGGRTRHRRTRTSHSPTIITQADQPTSSPVHKGWERGKGKGKEREKEGRGRIDADGSKETEGKRERREEINKNRNKGRD